MSAQNSSLKSFLYRRRFFFLLIMILSMIVAAPFIGDYSGYRFVVDMVATGVLIAAMYAISEKKHHLILAAFLVVPTIVTLWIDYFMKAKWAFITSEICGILFYGFCMVHIFNYIRRQKEVTREVIFASVIVYLLIAVVWSDLYQILESFTPGSFSIPDGPIQYKRILFLYFSLVTITTLGYGDMTPLTDQAAGLAAVEALIGQMYLVVMVAWLVGMYVSRRSKEGED